MIHKECEMKRTVIILVSFLLPGMISGQTLTDKLLKADVLLKNGKADQAVEVLNEALNEKSDSRLYNMRAEAEIIKGDFSAAIADLNKANEINNFSGEFGLAKIYALRGDATTSLYHLEICMNSPYRKSEKEIMLNPAFSKIENSPQWRSFWQKGWYPEIDTKLSEIEYYLGLGKIEEAGSILSDISNRYSESEKFIYASALVSFAQGNNSEALRSVTSLLSQEPKDVNYLQLLADIQSASSNYAGASQTYSRLINLEIPDAGLYLKRAECYRKTGETERALSDISKYISIYPSDKNALSLAGRIEAATGNNIKALWYFSENLKYHPNDPDCYIERANSYMSSKSWEWAVNDYSMSLDLDPSNPEAWLNKGVSQLNAAETENACHDFRQAYRLGNKKAIGYISKYCIK